MSRSFGGKGSIGQDSRSPTPLQPQWTRLAYVLDSLMRLPLSSVDSNFGRSNFLDLLRD